MTIEQIRTELDKVKAGTYIPMSWVSSCKSIKSKGELKTIYFVCDGLVRLKMNYANTKAGKEAEEARKAKGKLEARDTWFEHDDKHPAIVYHKKDASKTYLQIFLSHAKDIKTGSEQVTSVREIWNIGQDDECVITASMLKGGEKKLKALEESREKHEQPEQVFLKPIDKILSIGSYYKVK